MEAISRASASEPDCARYQIFGTLPSDAVARSSRESAADPDDAASIAEALEATRAACMSHLGPRRGASGRRTPGWRWWPRPPGRPQRAPAPRRRHALRGQRRGRVVHRVDAPRADALSPRSPRASGTTASSSSDRVPPAALAQARDRANRAGSAAARCASCRRRRMPASARGRGRRRARAPSVGRRCGLRAAATARGARAARERRARQARRSATRTRRRCAATAHACLAPFRKRRGVYAVIAVLPARLAAALAGPSSSRPPRRRHLRDPAGLNAAARAAFFRPRHGVTFDDDAVSVRAARPAEVRAVRARRAAVGRRAPAAAAGRRDARREDHRRVRDPRGGVASAGLCDLREHVCKRRGAGTARRV